jgi:hypothetical protein
MELFSSTDNQKVFVFDSAKWNYFLNLWLTLDRKFQGMYGTNISELKLNTPHLLLQKGPLSLIANGIYQTNNV